MEEPPPIKKPPARKRVKKAKTPASAPQEDNAAISQKETAPEELGGTEPEASAKTEAPEKTEPPKNTAENTTAVTEKTSMGDNPPESPPPTENNSEKEPEPSPPAKKTEKAKSKTKEVLEFCVLGLAALGALVFLMGNPKEEEKTGVSKEMLKDMGNTPVGEIQNIRASEKETAAKNKPKPALIVVEKNTPTPTPAPRGKPILDILDSAAGDSKLILTTNEGGALLLIETKNAKLIELINAKRITPGLRIEIETEPNDSPEAAAKAKELKAIPMRLKKLNLVKNS